MRLGAISSSKILKKGVQVEPNLKRELGTLEGLTALLECQLAQMLDPAQEPPD